MDSELENDPLLASQRAKEEAARVSAEIVQDTSDWVNATFDIVNCIAWKPADSQPKPKKRGSTGKGFQMHPDREHERPDDK